MSSERVPTMDEVREFVTGRGWRVLKVVTNLVTLHVPAIDIVRMSCCVRNAFAEVGVHLHPCGTEQPFTRPCALVEYDVGAMRALMHLVVNDDWMPRGRRVLEASNPPR